MSCIPYPGLVHVLRAPLSRQGPALEVDALHAPGLTPGLRAHHPVCPPPVPVVVVEVHVSRHVPVHVSAVHGAHPPVQPHLVRLSVSRQAGGAHPQGGAAPPGLAEQRGALTVAGDGELGQNKQNQHFSCIVSSSLWKSKSIFSSILKPVLVPS